MRAMTRTMKLKSCTYCAKEAYPGWIETDNNGPIVPCPACNNKSRFEIEYDRAVAQRSLSKLLEHAAKEAERK